MSRAVDVTLVGEQAIERILERRASDSMLGADSTSCWGLSIRQRHQHYPLNSAKSVPHGLMSVVCLLEGEIKRDAERILSLRSAVEHVVEMVREQDGALRVAARKRQHLVNGGTRLQPIALDQGLDVSGRLSNWQMR